MIIRVIDSKEVSKMTNEKRKVEASENTNRHRKLPKLFQNSVVSNQLTVGGRGGGEGSVFIDKKEN